MNSYSLLKTNYYSDRVAIQMVRYCYVHTEKLKMQSHLKQFLLQLQVLFHEALEESLMNLKFDSMENQRLSSYIAPIPIAFAI